MTGPCVSVVGNHVAFCCMSVPSAACLCSWFVELVLHPAEFVPNIANVQLVSCSISCMFTIPSATTSTAAPTTALFLGKTLAPILISSV